jgi:HK97 gp10 family phage protein
VIEVVGLPGLLAGFAAKAAEIKAAEQPAIAEGAELIREAWVANIESEGLVLTGAYRDSVHVEHEGAETVVKSDVHYAAILEYGDSRQAAHPVAERALEEHQDDAIERVATHLREVIR